MNTVDRSDSFHTPYCLDDPYTNRFFTPTDDTTTYGAEFAGEQGFPEICYQNPHGVNEVQEESRIAPERQRFQMRKDKAITKRNGARIMREKKKRTAATLKWLKENYCLCPGVCLPRENVYEHYEQFCRREKIEADCKATFGKVIKQIFPEVTSKRLGARGHSKYHYYGIAIKESSENYNERMFSGRGITRFSGCQMKNEGGFTRKYSLSSRTGTLLPEFPEADALKLPKNISLEKVQVFLAMYKIHCQCILDSAIGGNFEEIRSFLLHFWQGLPDHLLPLVKDPMMNDVISICDWILYKTMSDVLIPSTMQEMSEKLLSDIHNLAQNWEPWLKSFLENLPACVTSSKLPVARLFVRTLKRQVTFIHLAQTARPVLYDAQLVKSMVEDLQSVDLVQSPTFKLFPTVPDAQDDDNCDIRFDMKFLGEFQEELRKQAVVEGFIEWLDEVVQQKIIKEYLLLAIESQFLKEKEAELEDILQKHLKDSERNTLKRLCKPPSSCFLVNRHQCSSKFDNDQKKLRNHDKKSVLSYQQSKDRRRNTHENHRNQTNISAVPLGNDSILTPPLSPGSNANPFYSECQIYQTPNGRTSSFENSTFYEKETRIPDTFDGQNQLECTEDYPRMRLTTSAAYYQEVYPQLHAPISKLNSQVPSPNEFIEVPGYGAPSGSFSLGASFPQDDALGYGRHINHHMMHSNRSMASMNDYQNVMPCNIQSPFNTDIAEYDTPPYGGNGCELFTTSIPSNNTQIQTSNYSLLKY